ncbi:hypothetical protein FACS1894110_17250 [Spirochaetia bacterium]|nr:hypothetical protein FACS1894110_17250 [Spirochaetia bacterium]
MNKTYKGGTAALVAVLLAASFLPIGLMGCGTDTPPDDLDRVATPTATPGAGATSGGITLACATAGATIRYTTDGTTPTASTGTEYYEDSITIAGFPVTVKAIAYKAGMADSEVLTAAYTLLPPSMISYTMVSIPAGTVTASIGATEGPFSNAGSVPVTVPAFKMGETEVTYELWYAVKEWAKVNRGYRFANEGMEGYNEYDGWPVGAAPTAAKQKPVTFINFRDAVVWCNAYSEAMGRTPYYYLAGTSNFADSTRVLRVCSPDTTTEGSGNEENAAFNTSSANGYRLPTGAQWEYAARGGVPGTVGTPWTYTYAGTNTAGTGAGQLGDYAWYDANSGQNTHAVKTKNANSAGLYDMSGNVREWTHGFIVSSIGSRRAAVLATLRPIARLPLFGITAATTWARILVSVLCAPDPAPKRSKGERLKAFFAGKGHEGAVQKVIFGQPFFIPVL